MQMIRDAAAICGFAAIGCGLWSVDWRLALIICGVLLLIGATIGHFRGQSNVSDNSARADD